MHELYIQKKESPQITEQSSYKEFMAFTLEDVEESFE
jgi:hypothetical protein